MVDYSKLLIAVSVALSIAVIFILIILIELNSKVESIRTLVGEFLNEIVADRDVEGLETTGKLYDLYQCCGYNWENCDGKLNKDKCEACGGRQEKLTGRNLCIPKSS